MTIYEDVKQVPLTGPNGGIDETHPCYAQIRASRVSGETFLYGSDFAHQHFITIEISRSHLQRTLSRDLAYGQDELIEVALSEAQWATFVSSLNMGSGTQCTIRHINNKNVPQIPRTVSRKNQFIKEMSETTQESIKHLMELSKLIDELKVSGKTKETLLNKVDAAIREIQPNAQYIVSQFGEHMEDAVEKAKIEVNAYMVNAIMRAGLAVSQNKPLEITND